MPRGTLSGTLRGISAGLASLGDGAPEPEGEDFCGDLGDGREFNHAVSGILSRDLPKDATLSETLAPLTNGQDLCGSQPLSAPKDATQSCGIGLDRDAARQIALGADHCETDGCATAGSLVACCECGQPVAERLPTT
jgi:hypothetical protein